MDYNNAIQCNTTMLLCVLILIIHMRAQTLIPVLQLSTDLYRNELITSTWLENPDERPTFATIVQSLRSICNFTETTTIADTDSIIDTEETAESSNYISILPK